MRFVQILQNYTTQYWHLQQKHPFVEMETIAIDDISG